MRTVKKKEESLLFHIMFLVLYTRFGECYFLGVWGGLGERRLISLTFLTPGVEYYENSAKSLFCKEIKGVPFT